MIIDNSKTFLHTFFFGNNEYSADAIDKKVNPIVVQFCINERMIEIIHRNGTRLYRILPRGKEAIK